MTEDGVMGVTVETGASFDASSATLVVGRSYYRGNLESASGRTYDISPDGQRFLMLREDAASNDDPFAGMTQIHVVLNWHQELLERVPTGR